MTNKEMTSLEVLQEARQLLSNPDNWYKGCYAGKLKEDGTKVPVPTNGREPSWNQPEANCWCSMGAVLKVSKSKLSDSFYEPIVYEPIFYLSMAINQIDGRLDVARYNDAFDTTHEEILELFDLAIEIAKEDHAQ